MENLGWLWLIFLFILCFVGVHLIKLAKIGLDYTTEKSSKETTEKKSSPDKPKTSGQKAVYYVVNRNRYNRRNMR